MVDLTNFSYLCHQAAEKAYADLPDLGEQDQDKVWAKVAAHIGCQENIVMNSPAEDTNIEATSFEELVQYYKEGAVTLKFEEMIAAIADKDVCPLNLNEGSADQFDVLMDYLTPSGAIEMTWQYELENGGVYVNLEFADPFIAEFAKEELQSQLQAAYEARIDPKYYQIARCGACDHAVLESETPQKREFSKNNTHFHTACGYPSGIFGYTVITEANVHQIPADLREGEIWLELANLYNVESDDEIEE
jgi:hypothetical protein